MMSVTKPIVTPDDIQRQFKALDAIFAPKNVAVIGATESTGSVGRTLMWNLLTNPFGGTVFPINPKRSSVLGVKAYASIGDVPDPIDLAVIVTPSGSVPGLIKDCVDLGVRGAIIISAGFKEIGAEGAELERRILETAQGKMRIVGPNCLGVMMPHRGLNATFAGAMARPGNVGFISQSGALLTSVLDWSLEESVGFSAFISIGSMLDVSWGDLISYLGDDPQTQSIVINPLLASPEHILALDARVVLYDSSVREEDISRPAIRPYPTQYASMWTMNDGREILIRPIRPEDEPLMATYHETLSERSVVLRYFYPMALSERIEHERLSRLAFIDYDREMALVAVIRNRYTGGPQIVAAGRIIKLYGGEDAEFTILVSDAYQGYGLGTEMLRRLIEVGRKEGLQRIFGNILGDNANMLRVTERLGFQVVGQPHPGVKRVELDL